MSETLGKWEALMLWLLLARGGTAARADLDRENLLPKGDAKIATALVKAGYIVRGKREGQERGIRFEVTEKGWDKAIDHFGSELPDTRLGAKALQAWLTRLQAYMRTKDVRLFEILQPQRSGTDRTTLAELGQPATFGPTDYASLRETIRSTYLAITNGKLGTRARLSDLRERLKTIDRDALDDALKRMQRDREASLYRLDNRAEITDADRDAALFFGDEPRHLLWMAR